MATFIIYIIRWAVVLTMLYSLYGLFLKRETLHSFNRVVLLAILVASMVLPLVQVETHEQNALTATRELIEREIDAGMITSPTPAPPHEGKEMAAALSINGNSVGTPLPSRGGASVGSVTILALTLIYALGVVIAWLRYLWSLAALALLIRRGKRIEVTALPSGIKVLVHPNVKTPCSWMRWILLSPEDARLIKTPLPSGGVGGGLSGSGLLLHELSHIRLGHSWDMLLCELTCRMLWCVPFAWMLRQDLRDVHEFQADRRVLQSGINENEYQLLLIKKATSAGLQPVVNALNQSPIKRRFTMMYRKPSRRWVALKAAYLLPLSALALVAFARPALVEEMKQELQTAENNVVEYVATMTAAPKTAPEGASIDQGAITNVSPPGDERGAATDTLFTDSNLVAADLLESQPSAASMTALPQKSATELLDSTMLAVGARKIADGTYIGHFQPNLNSDTVRIATITIRDHQSQQTDEHLFAQNAADPYAYNITLNAETRKDRTGYYIRYLQPVKSAVRNYDQKTVDPNVLSTDSVLTGRSSKNMVYQTGRPIAIERSKNETRIYWYTLFSPDTDVETLRQHNVNPFERLVIVDEATGDKYVCRSTDYSYFKYIKDEAIGNDNVKVFQICLVFPPISKHVKEAHFGTIDSDSQNSNTFDLSELPRKPRIITQ